MSVLFDTGIVYAYYDRSDRWHARARTLLQGEQRGLIVPAPSSPRSIIGSRSGWATSAV